MRFTCEEAIISTFEKMERISLKYIERLRLSGKNVDVDKKILLFQEMKKNIENIMRKISGSTINTNSFFNKTATLADIRIQTNDSLIVNSPFQHAN